MSLGLISAPESTRLQVNLCTRVTGTTKQFAYLNADCEVQILYFPLFSVFSSLFFPECRVRSGCSPGLQILLSFVSLGLFSAPQSSVQSSNLLVSMQDVKCSGNWMWPAKLPGEGAALAEACSAMCSVMGELGVAVDGGKDSLSMAARVGTETVKAPGEAWGYRALRLGPQLSISGFVVVELFNFTGFSFSFFVFMIVFFVAPGTLVISAYAVCPDITATVTPDLKCPDGKGKVKSIENVKHCYLKVINVMN